jgi:hypothetical protein
MTDVYTSLPWGAVCEAVACLKLELRRADNVIRLPLVASGGGPPSTRDPIGAQGEDRHAGTVAGTVEGGQVEKPRDSADLGAPEGPRSTG